MGAFTCVYREHAKWESKPGNITYVIHEMAKRQLSITELQMWRCESPMWGFTNTLAFCMCINDRTLVISLPFASREQHGNALFLKADYSQWVIYALLCGSEVWRQLTQLLFFSFSFSEKQVLTHSCTCCSFLCLVKCSSEKEQPALCSASSWVSSKMIHGCADTKSASSFYYATSAQACFLLKGTQARLRQATSPFH